VERCVVEPIWRASSRAGRKKVVTLGEYLTHPVQAVKRQVFQFLLHTDLPARAARSNGVIRQTGSSSVAWPTTVGEMKTSRARFTSERDRLDPVLDLGTRLATTTRMSMSESGTSCPVIFEPNSLMSTTSLPSAVRTLAAKSAIAEASDGFSSIRRSPASGSRGLVVTPGRFR
jgi:hypothetical protein